MRLSQYFGWSSIISHSLPQNVEVTVVPAAVGFEADNTAFQYSSPPLLIANDGSAADGGFRAFESPSLYQWAPKAHLKTGRSKIALPINNVDGRNIVVTVAATDSIMRVFGTRKFSEIEEARKKILGDWSTLCSWRSALSGNIYLFLFGKKMAVQLLVRSHGRTIQILEVCYFSN